MRRSLGRTGFQLCPLAFGAFKIGRNEGTKYPCVYELPSEREVSALLNGVLDLGINVIDTAPAYGISEERIGRVLKSRRDEFYLSTKAGERFEDGQSTYDFSKTGIRRSVQSSLRRLNTEVVDLLFIHSNGDDERILTETDAVETVCELRDAAIVRAVGFSGKTVDGHLAALGWADAIMVEYHPRDVTHTNVIHAAQAAGVGVLVKKPLASGRLAPDEALPFILGESGVTSVVVGGLNLAHVRANLAVIEISEAGRES